MLMFINWFIIASIAIFTMNNEWVFLLFAIFLSQTILKIFRFLWSFALSFINLSISTFWLLVFVVMCILCVNTAKNRRDMHVKFAIFFAHSWFLFRFARAFELIACREMSLLFSLQRDIIRFLCSVDIFTIFWKICSVIFFCITSIFFLSAIFIMILRFLQSNNESFLKCCFFVVVSSFVMFAHDVISDDKCMFSCICNCLLNSWTDVFSFYTFFAMNVFWFMWCFSSDSSWKRCISFIAISFHERSLLFFFFNIDVFISKSIMLTIVFLSLQECYDFALLFSCDLSTSFSIIFELALLQLMQFIIIWSSSEFALSCM